MTTINTVEELSNLEEGSVINDAWGSVRRKVGDKWADEYDYKRAKEVPLPAQTLRPRVVTKAEVDKAAEAMSDYKAFTRRDWHDLPKNIRQFYIGEVRVALTALGFEVQG